MKQSLTVGAQLLWSGRYGCNNSRYGCTIVMSYIEINKAVSQWLSTFNLCVSVTWPLTCAFHIPCTHTPEIIDMHRGMCDNNLSHYSDVIMGTIASQITSLANVYSTFYSGVDQSKHQSSASRASNAENVSIWWRHHGAKTEWHNILSLGILTKICFIGINHGYWN